MHHFLYLFRSINTHTCKKQRQMSVRVAHGGVVMQQCRAAPYCAPVSLCHAWPRLACTRWWMTISSPINWMSKVVVSFIPFFAFVYSLMTLRAEQVKCMNGIKWEQYSYTCIFFFLRALQVKYIMHTLMSYSQLTYILIQCPKLFFFTPSLTLIYLLTSLSA